MTRWDVLSLCLDLQKLLACRVMISLPGPLKPQSTALSKLLLYLDEFEILDPLQKCFRSVSASKIQHTTSSWSLFK